SFRTFARLPYFNYSPQESGVFRTFSFGYASTYDYFICIKLILVAIWNNLLPFELTLGSPTSIIHFRSGMLRLMIISSVYNCLLVVRWNNLSSFEVLPGSLRLVIHSRWVCFD